MVTGSVPFLGTRGAMSENEEAFVSFWEHSAFSWHETFPYPQNTFFLFFPLWFCGADVFTASFLTSFSQLLKKELDQDNALAVGEKGAGGWQVQVVLPAASQTLPRGAVGKTLDKY